MPTLGDVQHLYDFLRRHPTGVDSFWAVVLLGPRRWILPATATSHPALLDGAAPSLALCASVALRRRAPSGAAAGRRDRPGPARHRRQHRASRSGHAGDRLHRAPPTAPAGPPGWRWRPACARPRCRRAALARATTRPAGPGGQAVFLTVPFALAWVFGDACAPGGRTTCSWRNAPRGWSASARRRPRPRSPPNGPGSPGSCTTSSRTTSRSWWSRPTAPPTCWTPRPSRPSRRSAPSRTTGRQALAEMRRLLGVLRDSDDSGGEYVPQPGVDQLGDLLEQVRGAGLPVTSARRARSARCPAAWS